MNKKADEFMNWPEITCFLALILGFLFTLKTQNVALQLIILFLVALAFGRMVFLQVSIHKVHLYIIILGFLIGFVLGAQANLKVILVVFLSGFLGSYYAHKHKWVPLLKG